MMKWRIVSIAMIVALALVLSISGASADSGSRTYLYLIGVEPLCGLDPSACPAVAMADNGDTIEITGSGTLTIHPDSVTGSGDFTHNFAGGGSIGGTWEAVELLSFHSYGSGAEQGLPEVFEGGLALIRVHLLADIGLEADAVLRVTCLLGDKIPSGAEEGVRLAVQDLINFNEEVSGFTVFIRTA